MDDDLDRLALSAGTGGKSYLADDDDDDDDESALNEVGLGSRDGRGSDFTFAGASISNGRRPYADGDASNSYGNSDGEDDRVTSRRVE